MNDKAISPTTHPPHTFSTPLVDVFDNDEELLLLADLPGVNKEDVQLRFEGESLLVQGTHRDGRHVFRRSFLLSEPVQADRIEAELAEGVLTVHLPKAEHLRPRQIPIR